jgi:hypothetical protein
MSKPILINCELYWASLSTKNELSDKYQVDLCNVSDAAVDAMEEMGLTIINKQDEKGNHVTAKSTNPIKAYNEAGDEIISQVGNGSIARVQLYFYDWTFNAKKGRSPSIQKLVVTDLEVYESAEIIDANIEDAL